MSKAMAFLRRIIPQRIVSCFRPAWEDCNLRYRRISYSQEGEDLIMARIFQGKEKGFYVDIGAHHPYRFSNTFYFYKLGWRGINIDAMPGSMDKFNKLRKRDLNVESAISSRKQKLPYYIFNELALNGFSKNLSQLRDKANNVYSIVATKELETYTLEEVLDKWMPVNQEIDFMSVDVEGLDLDVLKSNNWIKYRPGFLLVEILQGSSDSVNKEIPAYLKSLGYEFCAKSVNTVVFCEKNRCGEFVFNA